MKHRYRTKESFALSGRVSYPPEQVAGPFPYQTTDWECSDYIEKKKDPVSHLTPPSDFVLKKTDIIPPFLSYRLSSMVDGILYYESSRIPCSPPGGLIPDSPPSGWDVLEGTTAELTAKLLSNSNPFRYTISVPVMILELMEAASLLKLAANNFFSLLGSAHLNLTFGWEATIGDIRTLASITKSIENRIKEFNDIVEKGGSRRRVYLTSSGETTPEYTQSIYSSGMGEWSGKVVTSYKTKVWGSVRWVPNRANPIDFSQLSDFNEAMKVVLDLRVPDASTIWEAIPFSWLVDYFANIGDTLQAIEDTDKVLPTDVCIMREHVVTTRTIGIPKNVEDYPWRRDNSISDGLVTHRVLHRNVVSPDSLGDLLSFGFMTKRQATNLFALLLSLNRFK